MNNHVISCLQLSSAMSGNITSVLKASNGGAFATFTDLGLAPAGLWSLVFSAAGLNSAISQPFLVLSGAPVALTLVVEPRGAFGGSAFETQPIIAAVDQGDNLANITSSWFQVVPYLVSPPSYQARLNGASASTNNSFFYFSDLSVNKVGFGYTIEFRMMTANWMNTSVIDVTSKPFDVKPGPPASFFISTQPSAIATAALPLPVQPAVLILDSGGNPVNSSIAVQVFFHSLFIYLSSSDGSIFDLVMLI